MKTLKLRELITEQLRTLGVGVYYRKAPLSATFPFLVYDLDRTNLSDMARDDYNLGIDIFDKSSDPKHIDAIADELDELLNGANLPNGELYPTFYRDTRYPIEESDKTLQHLAMQFSIQMYTEGV